MDDYLDISPEKPETKPLFQWEQEDFFNLICTNCEFYKPEEEKLECGAFKILVELLKGEVILIEQVAECQCQKR